MESRKVKYVQLHGPMHVPGIGTVPQTLPSQTKTFSDLDMTLIPGIGILVKLKYQSRTCEFSIQHYQCAELVSE